MRKKILLTIGHCGANKAILNFLSSGGMGDVSSYFEMNSKGRGSALGSIANQVRSMRQRITRA
jgi:hypothetical protein